MSAILRPMPKLFDRAIAAARKLPPDEQETLGAIILDEIADERRWARKFAESRDVLERLADEALVELNHGTVTPLEFPDDR